MAPDDSAGTGTDAPVHSRHGSAPPSRPPSPSQPPPSQQLQPLFVSQAVFDQLSHGKEATPKFPPIVQGFVASAFTFREYAFCCFPRVSARGATLDNQWRLLHLQNFARMFTRDW